MEDIVSSLHTLEGNSIGEKFKNLNKIILNLKSNGQPPEFINSVIRSFSPQNELEKLIKMKLIDTFQYTEEIYNIINSGDLFMTTWALKCDWFFISHQGKDLKFFKKLFPDLSYSLRFKVLKKYSKFLNDQKTGDLLFDFLKETYGLQTATLVLPACSEPFVEKVLESHSKYISASIFTQLYDLYPSLLIKFVTNILKNMKGSCEPFYKFDTDKYEDIFRKIATHDTQLFMTLFEGYMNDIRYSKFGLRLIRRLVKTDINAVVKNARLYCKIISLKHIVKVLSRVSEENVKNVHFALMPSSVSDFFATCNSFYREDYMELLNYLSPELREKIIVTNFKRKYGEDISNYLSKIQLTLVRMLPANIREEWAKYQLSKVTNDSDFSFYSMLPTAEAISKLKVIIKGEVLPDRRRDIIDAMYNSVKPFSYDTVLELTDYVVKKYRNDALIRITAVEKLKDYDLSKLDPDRWKPITELLNFMSIYNDTSRNNDIIHILSMFVHSRLNKNMDVDEQLKWILKIHSYSFTFRIAEGTQHDKYCLEWFLSQMKNETNFADKEDSVTTLFLAIHSWNMKHPNDKISYSDWIIDLIYDYITSARYMYTKDEVLRAIKVETQIKEKLYDRLFMSTVLYDVLMDRLRFKPAEILSNVDRIMATMLKDSIQSYRPFFIKVRLLSTLGLPKKVVDICMKNFNDSENFPWVVRRNSVFVLSLLIPTSDYVQLAVPYYPKKSSLEDFSTESQDIFSMLSEIISNFKNCNNPQELFEPIKKFAIGDYLKLVVGPMNCLFLKTAEHKVLEIVLAWLDCPVSVRKHLIRAFSQVAPLDRKFSFLLDLFVPEKNLTLRVYMFQYIFKYFMSEPNQKTWDTLKTAISNLKAVDKDGITLVISNISKIEECYILEYLEMIWNTVHNTEGIEPERVAHYEWDIIHSISSTQVKYLSEEFCQKMLSLFNLEISYSLQEGLLSFSVFYLVTSSSEEQLKERFELVMRIIELIIKNGWNECDIKNPPVCPARSLIKSFISTLVSRTSSGTNTKSLLTMFEDRLHGLIDETTLFSDIMMLKLSIALHEAKENHVGGEGNTFSTFILKLARIVDKYCQKFGGELVPLFTSLTQTAITWQGLGDYLSKKPLLTSELLLSNTNSKYCQMIAIELISSDVTALEKCFDKYTEILNTLHKIEDPSVKIYLNNHLMSLH